MAEPAFLHSAISGYPVRRGKVRDVYDLGDTLAIIATDRISAFDWIMPTGIPGKGRILTQLSEFWFGWLGVPHHLLSTNLADFPAAFQAVGEPLVGRSMLCRKTRVIPMECVARGYLVGSGWKEYQATGAVCGEPLPPGFVHAAAFPRPLFTPAIKAESGHDENIPFSLMLRMVGPAVATELRERTLSIYERAAAYAQTRGLILADTKFEFGTLPDGEIILVDEVLTPDSSRFWPRDAYQPGGSPPSFDKQYLRDWLEQTGWNKESPPPALPDEIVANTLAKYEEALRRLTATE
ncbi:MAG: phosphoribosylaminoimidazolesuccinocarboxamide synthase [Gemmataceae bacterium]